LVTVQSPSGKYAGTAKYPDVFLSPIRTDLVVDVHTKMNKNHRQAHAVSSLAGEDTSAQSWGTGRAVSRIPRVSGGGTNRSGQGAFGNMCRGGRMFAPTKVWRRWHVKINTHQKRFATCSALAASAVAPLVLARGHRISTIPEVPLVVADSDIQQIAKTKLAVALLKQLGLKDELQKVIDSRHIRPGKGKVRNRRYIQSKGPLIVHNKNRENSTIEQAFRNIPGVELAHVNRLNLLKLAPGGHVGRLIIWTESAFKELNGVFGTRTASSLQKKGFQPPRSVLTNCDVTRIINSREVQSQLRDKKKVYRPRAKKNPYKSVERMVLLNPYSAIRKKRLLRQGKIEKKRTPEEKQKIKAQKAQIKKDDKKKNPRTEFKKVLLSAAAAPVRSELEIGVLAGNK